MTQQHGHVLDPALDHGDQGVTDGADGEQGQEHAKDHRQHLDLAQLGHLHRRLGRLRVRAASFGAARASWPCTIWGARSAGTPGAVLISTTWNLKPVNSPLNPAGVSQPPSA